MRGSHQHFKRRTNTLLGSHLGLKLDPINIGGIREQRDTRYLAAEEPIWIKTMDLLQPFLLLLCALHLTLTAVLSKHIDHRNLFTQRMCCKRQSHFVYVGQDISGSPVSVDVGMCRSHCGGASRPSPEAGQQEYSKHSSMLEFLRSKKVSGVSPTRPQGRAVTL
ncbi:uncharacterized protein pnhd [Acanthopagrus schlegelii]